MEKVVTDPAQPIHRESVTSRTPPTVFGASRGPFRLLAVALPSEMVSAASLITIGLVFASLSFNESQQYFFRMKSWWLPPAFSAVGLVISLLIVLVGGRRPGPLWPRVWAILLVLLNATLVLAALAAGVLPPAATGMLPAVPLWLADPFPLHSLTISVTAGTGVLLARLVPVHPMHLSVQAAAPVASAVFMVLAYWPSAIYIASEIAAEKRILEAMASRLNEATRDLTTAAHFDYTAPAEEGETQRVDEALAGLALPTELPLPDSRRWRAAGVLERGGEMKPGQLETSVRAFIDAIHDVSLPDALPPLRGGRFRLNPTDATYFQDPDQRFERPVDLALRYYRPAAAWLPLLARLEQGPVAAQAVERRRDIAAGLAPLARQGDSAWRSWQIQLLDDLDPPGRLAEVLALPMGVGTPAALDAQSWTRLPWRRANALRGPAGPCDATGPRVTRRESIIAPDDRLSEEELEERQLGLATFYIGTIIDAFAVIRCFAYHPPFGDGRDPDNLVVTEMRLNYSVSGRVLPSPNVCRSMPCGRGAIIPQSDMPSSVELLIDIPPGADANFQNEVGAALAPAVKGGTLGAQDTHTQPDGRTAVRFLWKVQ